MVDLRDLEPKGLEGDVSEVFGILVVDADGVGSSRLRSSRLRLTRSGVAARGIVSTTPVDMSMSASSRYTHVNNSVISSIGSPSATKFSTIVIVCRGGAVDSIWSTSIIILSAIVNVCL